VHRHKGIKKVAIIDFDVHHGNGTEALVANTAPSAPKVKISTPWSSGEITTNTCKPWMDPDTDKDEIFFASVHGYGRMSNFYPGTGPTKDTKQRQEQNDINFENEDNNNNTSTENDNTDTGYVSGYSSAEDEAADGVVKDDQKVLAEMETATFEKPPPRIVDVGMIGEGKRAERGSSWRRVWRAKVLPALDEFKPDLVFISAGFDAHSKDAIQGPVNLGVKELDYEWLTNELCEIANKHAGGRVISVLEGGYRIQGKAVSAFGRSVASHCKALFATHNTDCFDEKLNARILEKEVAKKREQRELVRLERLERETEQLRRRQEERERELLRLQELEENGGVETEEGGAPTEAAEAAAPPPAEVQEVGGKRRRRGGAVDYAALNAKMLEEQQQEQKQKEEKVEEQDPPAVPIVIDDDDEENENVDEENMEEDDEEDDMDAEEEDEEELADA
jgi:acetoin utilization deacetylase AcuC-like enzyme